MKKGMIFDMDGLSIESEPYWEEAKIKIFKSYGCYLDKDICNQTTGLKMLDALDFWRDNGVFSSEDDNDTVSNKIVSEAEAMILQKSTLKEGILELMSKAKNDGRKIAVCSSSSMFLITSILEKMKLSNLVDVVHSATESKNGKPFPDPYLDTAEKIGVKPENCIGLEDSVVGATASKSAGLFTIAIPEFIDTENKLSFCDLVVSSAKDINYSDLP